MRSAGSNPIGLTTTTGQTVQFFTSENLDRNQRCSFVKASGARRSPTMRLEIWGAPNIGG
jgi:hypothetical protein